MGDLERRASDGVASVLDYYRGKLDKEGRRVCEADLGIMGKVLESRLGVETQSRAVYARDLWVIFRDLGKPIDAATADDVARCIRRLRDRGSARKRISLLRAALEAGGRMDLLSLTKKVRLKEKAKLQDTDILTAEDVARLIRDAPTRRDKVIIAVLWESGRRIHEVLALNVADVVPVGSNGESYFRGIFRKSKTKGNEGSCLLVESAPWVRAWLERHPLREQPAAPFFVDTIGAGLNRYTYSAVYAMLERVNAATNLAKPVRPHAFRHARITALLRAGWNEAAIKKAVGLSPRSQELARYGHLVSADIDNKVLAMNGRAPLEAPKISGLPAPEDLESVPAMPMPPPGPELSALEVEVRRLVADMFPSIVRGAMSNPEFLELLRSGVKNDRGEKIL